MKFLRLPAVLEKRAVSRSKHYDDIKRGLYTQPIKLGARACGWPDVEVEALNAARVAGMLDEEIRTLVDRLQAARKSGELRACLALVAG